MSKAISDFMREWDGEYTIVRVPHPSERPSHPFQALRKHFDDMGYSEREPARPRVIDPEACPVSCDDPGHAQGTHARS